MFRVYAKELDSDYLPDYVPACEVLLDQAALRQHGDDHAHVVCCDVSGLLPGRRYNIVVCGVNDAGEGAASSAAEFLMRDADPSASKQGWLTKKPATSLSWADCPHQDRLFVLDARARTLTYYRPRFPSRLRWLRLAAHSTERQAHVPVEWRSDAGQVPRGHAAAARRHAIDFACRLAERDSDLEQAVSAAFEQMHDDERAVLILAFTAAAKRVGAQATPSAVDARGGGRGAGTVGAATRVRRTVLRDEELRREIDLRTVRELTLPDDPTAPIQALAFKVPRHDGSLRTFVVAAASEDDWHDWLHCMVAAVPPQSVQQSLGRVAKVLSELERLAREHVLRDAAERRVMSCPSRHLDQSLPPLGLRTTAPVRAGRRPPARGHMLSAGVMHAQGPPPPPRGASWAPVHRAQQAASAEWGATDQPARVLLDRCMTLVAWYIDPVLLVPLQRAAAIKAASAQNQLEATLPGPAQRGARDLEATSAEGHGISDAGGAMEIEEAERVEDDDSPDADECAADAHADEDATALGHSAARRIWSALCTRGRLAALRVSLYYAMLLALSCSEVLATAAVLLAHILSPSFVSVGLPVFVLLCTLPAARSSPYRVSPPSYSSPWPWKALVGYLAIMVVTKFLVQLPLLCMDMAADSTQWSLRRFPRCPTNATDVSMAANVARDHVQLLQMLGIAKVNPQYGGPGLLRSVFWDLVALFAVLFHRYCLQLRGLWRADVKCVYNELRLAAMATVTAAQSAPCAVGNEAVPGVAPRPEASANAAATVQRRNEGAALPDLPPPRPPTSGPIAPGAHWHGLIFTSQLASLLFTMFLYTAMTSRDTTLDLPNASRVYTPGYFVAVLAQVAFLVVDHIAWLKRDRTLKWCLHVVFVCGLHITIFAITVAYDVPLAFNQELATWFYLLQVVYMVASALQVRGGYPVGRTAWFMHPRSERDDHHTWAGKARWAMRLLYRHVLPLVSEVQEVLDWFFVPTTLNVFRWLQLRQLHNELYEASRQACIRARDRHYYAATDRPACEKWTFCCFAVTGGLLLLLLPLLVFTPINPQIRSNHVTGVHTRIELVFLNVSAPGGVNLFTAPTQEYLELATAAEFDRLRSITTHRLYAPVRSYWESRTQVVRMPIHSPQPWQPTDRAIDDLRRELQRPTCNLALRLDLVFVRPLPEGNNMVVLTQTTDPFSVPQCQKFARAILGALSTSSGSFRSEPLPVPRLLPLVAHLPASGEPRVLDKGELQERRSLVALRLQRERAHHGGEGYTKWWSATVGNTTMSTASGSSERGLQLAVVSDGVLSGLLNSLGASSAAAFFVSVRPRRCRASFERRLTASRRR